MRWFLAGLLEKELAKAAWEPFRVLLAWGSHQCHGEGEMRTCQKSQSL